MFKVKLKSIGLVVCVAAGALGLSACRQDMHDNPRFEAYEDGANRQPPEGAVARGSLDLSPSAPKVTAQGPAQGAQGAQQSAPVGTSTPASGVPSGTAGSTAAAPAAITGEDGFPFALSENADERRTQLKAILDRGESRFNISCLPCHGKLGDGNGMIVQRGFRRPPSYHEERLRKAPSSYFYDVMTNGFGAMPSYSDQLTPEDRWKVAAYIRVLQLSQRANVAELAESDKEKIVKAASQAGAQGQGHPGQAGQPSIPTSPQSAPQSGSQGGPRNQ